MTELRVNDKICSACGKSFDGRSRNWCMYWDEERGISGAPFCGTCYAKHILKYYPDSRVAEHIRDNPEEYGIGAGDETIDKGRATLVHRATLDKEIRQIGLFDALEAVCETPIEQSKAEGGRS